MPNMIFSTDNLNKVFSENEKLENFKTLRYDLITGNTTYDYDENGNKYEISKKDANKAVRKVLMEICGLNEETVKNTAKRQRAIKNHGLEIFEVTEEDVQLVVEKGIEDDPWFMKFVESRNQRLGDSNEFWTKEDITFVVAEVAGSLHDFTMQNLNEGQFTTVKAKNYAVKVGKDIDLVLLGRVDYTELTQHIADAYILDIKFKTFTAMYGAIESLPSQFKKTGTFGDTTKDKFDTLISDVAIANKAETYIVGTKTALKKLNALAKVDWASDGQKNEMAQMGRLGSYEGTQLIEIPQRFKMQKDAEGNYVHQYPDNVLFIFSNTEDKFIKYYDIGDTTILEKGTNKGDLADDFQTYEVQRSYGVGVMLGRYFGAWTIE